ncbi:allatostatin-A receptor-like [Tubulanus polymorphus]|uniref:allatostatin-A receptor-like n=1 Tax=Tubulanus polymorphus TaxID=672921 RepID=UPI003DA33C80
MSTTSGRLDFKPEVTTVNEKTSPGYINWTFSDFEFEKQQLAAPAFVSIFGVFIALVLVGNCTVVMLVIVERKLHRPTNYYITSLCVSGTLFSVFATKASSDKVLQENAKIPCQLHYRSKFQHSDQNDKSTRFNSIKSPPVNSLNRLLITVYLTLAVYNILVAVFALPMEIMAHYDERFMTSHLCKTLQFFVHVSLTANIYGVVVIAVDRYRSILHPFSTFQSTKYCLICISFVWTLSSVSAWRGAAIYDVKVHLYRDRKGGWTVVHACGIPKYFNAWNRGLIIYDFLSTYVVPLFVLLALYARIFRRIYDKNVNFLTEQKRVRNARVVRMLVAIVVLFACCQLPLHVWKLYVHLGPGPFLDYLIWYDVFDVISFTNSWLNVAAYVGFNDNFKREFRARLPCSRSPRSHMSTVSTVKANAIVPTSAALQSRIEDRSIQQQQQQQQQQQLPPRSPSNRAPESSDIRVVGNGCVLDDSRPGTDL